MPQYAVGVGANLGDRRITITRAQGMLNASQLARVVKASPLTETAAVGGPPGQPPYLNGCWLVATKLGPHGLLHLLQQVETASGRVRTVRWGARRLDLDLLLAEDGRTAHSSVLALPHPRLHERAFVLQGLAAVAPHWRHPALGLSIAALWRALAQPA